jgi:hypothetical protein
MRIRSKLMTASLSLALISPIALTGCDRPNERWATTENTNVALDWDKLNQAYKEAEGPADFEKRVNEIYQGDEVISVSVRDLEDNSQVVTGFFDKDKSGTVQDAEKIFTIKRTVTGEGTGHYQTQGYGPHYGYYHSPMMGLVSGMLMGSMISSAFRPNYVPMYQRPYTTPPSRIGDLHGARSAYRAANPSSVRPKASGSGRSYGTRPGRGGFRSGGGRFGIRRRQRAATPLRLTA